MRVRAGATDTGTGTDGIPSNVGMRNVDYGVETLACMTDRQRVDGEREYWVILGGSEIYIRVDLSAC